MPRSARYSVNGERSSGTASTPSKAGSDGSGRYNGFSDATNGIRAVSAMNLACAMKSPLRANSPASVKMSPPLPKPKSYQSSFRHVHTERGGAFTAVRRTIPQLVSAPPDRLMSQPCEKVREGYLPHGVYIGPFHAARVS